MIRPVWFAVVCSCAALSVRTAIADPPADRWVEIGPPGRTDHASVYDSRHRRLIVFGGRVEGSARNDVWVLSLSGRPRWDRIEPAGAGPSPRSGVAAAYDPLRDRLVVFGGRDNSGLPLDDLWALSLRGQVSWTPITTGGPQPGGRWRATLTPDPDDGSLVLCGGEQAYGRKLGDVWKLSLPGLEWRPVTTSGTSPLARSGHTAVYCPDLHGVLVFGGEFYGPLPDCPACVRNSESAEIWLLTLGEHPAWTLLRASSTEGPCEVQGHVAAWDAVAHRMLVFGGGNSWRACAVSSATVWSLSVPSLSWSRLAPQQPWPRARSFAAAFFDPDSRDLYVHGGGASFADAWRLSLDSAAAWTLLAPAGVTPQFRTTWQLPALYDPLRDRVVVDGGNGVWTYDIDNAIWSPFVASGEAPPARSGHLAVIDTKRDRLVTYGGQLASFPFTPVGQVWALSLGDAPHWTQLPTRGQPPGALFAAAIYDPVRDRLLVYGLGGNVSDAFGVFALPLGTDDAPEWRSLNSAPDPNYAQPFAAQGAVAAYDSRRDRLVIFGGGYRVDGWIARNGCWAFSLSDAPLWDELSRDQYWPHDSSLPWPSMFAGGAYDVAGDRLIVVGGVGGGFIYSHLPDDAWALGFSSNRWARLDMESTPHPAWINPAAVYDPRRQRTLVFQNDVVWAFESGHTARRDRTSPIMLAGSITPTGPGTFELHASPNPSANEMMVRFALPDGATATLELLDIAGRQVWKQDVGSLGAGTHVLRVPRAYPRAPGLYLLRLTRGSAAMTTKVIQLRE